MTVSEQIEELTFEKNYHDFPAFIEDCQDRLYRKLFSLFEEIYQSGPEEKRLKVSATVDKVKFESRFVISRETSELFTGVISKYFEEIEEYETCSKILKMCLYD